MPDKLKSLLTSRKFWAAIVGLVVIILKAYQPTLPFTADQITAFVVVIVGYILGTAIQDAIPPAPPTPPPSQNVVFPPDFWPPKV